MQEQLKIREDFKALIPPLSEDERQGLEDSILEHGCRDALLTWNGWVIDGHNRYEICEGNGIEYRTQEVEFEDEGAVKIWMIRNQFGRRNLDAYTRAKLAIELKGLFAAKAKENQVRKPESVLQISAKQKIDTRQELARIAGTSHDTIAKVERIERDATPEVRQALQRQEISINAAYHEVKKKEISDRREAIKEVFENQEIAPSEKKYKVIYADPPWSYGNGVPVGTTSPADYYLLMSTPDICLMPVKDIAQPDSVLFIWCTSPHLPECLEVIKAWGFTYKSSFIWDKIKHNMGYYNSVRHEFLLVATRGACTPEVKKLFDSVVSVERTEHSAKPEFFREIIDTIYPSGNRIELFARQSPEGWDVFGNQSDKR